MLPILLSKLTLGSLPFQVPFFSYLSVLVSALLNRCQLSQIFPANLPKISSFPFTYFPSLILAPASRCQAEHLHMEGYGPKDTPPYTVHVAKEELPTTGHGDILSNAYGDGACHQCLCAHLLQAYR